MPRLKTRGVHRRILNAKRRLTGSQSRNPTKSSLSLRFVRARWGSTSMMRFRLIFEAISAPYIESKQSTRSRLHSHVFKPPSYTPGTRSEGASTKSSSERPSLVPASSSEISWNRASKRSLRAMMTCRLEPRGMERGEYEMVGGSAEIYTIVSFDSRQSVCYGHCTRSSS